jgi:hypothetical protein
MVQRQACAVPVDATQQQISCFSVVEGTTVQQWRCHGCHRRCWRQALDKFPKYVDLVPSDVVWCRPDKAVKIAQFDTVRINQSHVADAKVSKL